MKDQGEHFPQKKYSKRRIIFFIGLAILLAVVVYLVGRWVEARAEKPEERGDANLRHAFEHVATLDYEGRTYRRRPNQTTILLIGVDKVSTSELKNSYRNGGQSDFLRLLVIDSDDEKIYQLAIDRDTITPITILGVLGNETGTRTEHISLAHSFGDGKEQSCELCVKAVSNLLYGLPIDFYMALNMDGISDLNDLIGGVTVTLEDDFSSIDPDMTKGKTITLEGEQAEIFVRSRMSVGIGTNEARMKRQEVFLSEAQRILMSQVRADSETVGLYYDRLSPYLVTNISRGRLINEAYAARNYEWADAVTPSGRHEIDSKGFMAFYFDADSLQKIVVDMFYE